MNRRINVSAFAFLFFLITLVSCDLFKNDGVPEPKNQYFVSRTLLMTYLDAMVKVTVQAVEKAYPDASGLSQHVKYGFFVYKVDYNTTFNNQQVLASGLVCVPIASGTFPLLSFQNGTNTLHSMAPTVAYTDSLVLLIQTVSSFGFIVAIPDYLGFGSSESMFHPYLHKASTVRSITDFHRAIQEMMVDFPTTAMSDDIYLMGYSQGGWATMALKKELETSPNPGFNLKATSCGAGPYDLTYICNRILSQATYPQPYFLAYMVNSYIKAGEISLTYTDIFNPPYSAASYISDLYNGTRDGDYINSKLSTSVSTLFTSDIIANLTTSPKYASLRTALDRNSVTAWKTTSPTLLMHGMGDTFVTPVVTNNLYLDFLAKGTSSDVITYTPIPLLDHREAVIPWGLHTVAWIMSKKG